MSTYVLGKKPKSDKGEDFVTNAMWWRRLWEFSCTVAGVDGGFGQPHYCNDGLGLDEKGALAMASALRLAIENGEVDAYAKGLAEAVANEPGKECEICRGSGVRSTPHGKAECYDCKGTGKVYPPWTHYPFKRSNVELFIEFLEASGGFEIW